MDTNLGELSTTVQELINDILAFIPNLVISLVIFILALYFAGWISKMLGRWLTLRDADKELTLLLITSTRWALIILGTTMALNQIGFNLTAFLTGLGILGFTVGFAIQDVSKNFIAGLLLLIEQPFDIGDGIEVAGFGGTVQDVDLRATELKTWDGRVVLIPNADVFTSSIVNYSKATTRRINLKIGLAYGTDLEAVRTATLAAIAEVDGILDDPAPQVVYNEFGASTINFDLYYWIDTADTGYFAAQDEGIVRLNDAYTAAGIELPYPIQTILLKQK